MVGERVKKRKKEKKKSYEKKKLVGVKHFCAQTKKIKSILVCMFIKAYLTEKNQCNAEKLLRK